MVRHVEYSPYTPLSLGQKDAAHPIKVRKKMGQPDGHTSFNACQSNA